MDTLHPVDDPASGTPGSCFQGFPHTQRTSAANQAAATGFSTPPAAPGSWAPGSWGPPIPPPRFCTTDSSHQSPVACQVSGLMAATWPPPAGHGQQNCFQQQSATTAQDSALAELTQQFQDSMHMVGTQYMLGNSIRTKTSLGKFRTHHDPPLFFFF